jgi:hypothetical protein
MEIPPKKGSCFLVLKYDHKPLSGTLRSESFNIPSNTTILFKTSYMFRS